MSTIVVRKTLFKMFENVLLQIRQIFADVIAVRTLPMFLHVDTHVGVQRRQVVAVLALDPRHGLQMFHFMMKFHFPDVLGLKVALGTRMDRTGNIFDRVTGCGP